MSDECRHDHRVDVGAESQSGKRVARDRIERFVDPPDSLLGELGDPGEAQEQGALLSPNERSSPVPTRPNGFRARARSSWKRILGSSSGPSSDEPTPSVRVLIEARGILAGRAADPHAARGGPMPYWTWLNALAHRPPRALRAVATAYPFGALTLTMISIADELDRVSLADALAIQAAVLLPAELTVLAGGNVSPGAVFKAVQRNVAQLGPRPGRS